jgi:hypothetical protein
MIRIQVPERRNGLYSPVKEARVNMGIPNIRLQGWQQRSADRNMDLLGDLRIYAKEIGFLGMP